MAAGLRRRTAQVLLTLLGVLVVGSCQLPSTRPVALGMGPQPELPAPIRPLIPTLSIAPAVGWADGQTPVPAAGLRVKAFATGLDHPRWLYVLPNGDVLVAETNTPARLLHDDVFGVKGWFMKRAMKRAGAGTPSANRITLLRDTDGDGVADVRTVFLAGLNSPFGMALVGDTLYVANTDAVMRFPYREGDTRVDVMAGSKLADLPGGPINHHWTKGLIASPDGTKLYASVGSNSDHAEHGLAVERGRAAIWEIDRVTGAARVFAQGLRNPVGMAWHGDRLWTVVNERDELGHDLVPDYLTHVQAGGFYGWPFTWFGHHVDPRVRDQDTSRPTQAIVPDYALGAHTASLGLADAAGNRLPPRFGDGMFIGQHGSWNRKPKSGYKVVFVPFRDGRPDGLPTDVLTGFLDDQERALGRPVGVVIDGSGALLAADDVGNIIWRVTSG